MGYYDEPEVRRPLWTNNFPIHRPGDEWSGARRTKLGEWSRVMFELGNHFTHSVVPSLITAYYSEEAPECNANLKALFNMPRLDE